MEKIKILVVDDEARMRKLVKDFLEREGYTVIEAKDGMDALEKFYDEKDIALIILDVMMPLMDGMRAIQKLVVIRITASQLLRMFLWWQKQCILMSPLHHWNTLPQAVSKH